MAIPTLVGTGTYAAGAGDITPTLPAGTQADDILVLQIETNGNQPATESNVPLGWTEFPDSPQDEAVAGGVCQSAFWKRHDGSESDPLVTDTGNHQSAFVYAFRGVRNTGNPYDEGVSATNGHIDGSADTSFSSATITTTEDDCLVLCFASHGADGLTAANFGAPSNSSVANIGDLGDDSTDAGSGGGIALFTGEKATAGAVDAFTSTMANTAAETSIVVALVGASDGTDATVTLPAAGILSMTSTAPAVNFSSSVPLPAAGILAMTSVAPAVTYSGQVSLPAAGILTLAGDAPSVVAGTIVSLPAAGVLVLGGVAPAMESVSGGSVFNPVWVIKRWRGEL